MSSQKRGTVEEFRQSEEYRKNAAGFRHDLSKEEVKAHYDEWGKDNQYENQLSLEIYKAPIKVAEIMAEFLGAEFRSAKVLDCAAGTGYVGQLLAKQGFTNMYALEPSTGMAAFARSKNVYKAIYEDFIDESASPFSQDEFDALVCVGSFGAGHIPTKALKEMARIVRPGGFIFISYREEYVEECTDLEPYMKTLEEDGKWVMKSRIVYPQHLHDLPGVCVIFEVL